MTDSALGTRAAPSPAQYAVLAAIVLGNVWWSRERANYLLGASIIAACTRFGWIAVVEGRVYVTPEGWNAMRRREAKIAASPAAESEG